MFNARDLLGQLMQTGMADSSSDRLRHAMGSEGLGRQDNPLGQLLQGLGGGVQEAAVQAVSAAWPRWRNKCSARRAAP